MFCACRFDPGEIELKEEPATMSTNVVDSVRDSSPYYEELSFARPPLQTDSITLARNEAYCTPGDECVRVHYDTPRPNHPEVND